MRIFFHGPGEESLPEASARLPEGAAGENKTFVLTKCLKAVLGL